MYDMRQPAGSGILAALRDKNRVGGVSSREFDIWPAVGRFAIRNLFGN
jgi:hypothetical protein